MAFESSAFVRAEFAGAFGHRTPAAAAPSGGTFRGGDTVRIGAVTGSGAVGRDHGIAAVEGAYPQVRAHTRIVPNIPRGMGTGGDFGAPLTRDFVPNKWVSWGWKSDDFGAVLELVPLTRPPEMQPTVETVDEAAPQVVGPGFSDRLRGHRSPGSSSVRSSL